MLSLDAYDDGGLLLKTAGAEIAQALGVDPAALLKQAVPVDKQSASKFPDEEFAAASKSSRYFNMTDEANTLLSVIYFLAKGEELPGEKRQAMAARLARRMMDFGHDKVATILGEYAGEDGLNTGDAPVPISEDELVKKPLPSLKAGDKKDGTKKPKPSRAFALRGQVVEEPDKKEIEAIASDIDSDLHKYTPLELRSAALQLVGLGAERLPKRLAQYAGLEHNASLPHYLHLRYQQVPETNKPDMYVHVQRILEEQDLEKQAALLYTVDSTFGAFRGVPDAVQSVVSLPAPVVTPAPVLVQDTTIEKIASILGSDVAAAVKDGKNATLPESTQAVIARICKEVQ